MSLQHNSIKGQTPQTSLIIADQYNVLSYTFWFNGRTCNYPGTKVGEGIGYDAYVPINRPFVVLSAMSYKCINKSRPVRNTVAPCCTTACSWQSFVDTYTSGEKVEYICTCTVRQNEGA